MAEYIEREALESRLNERYDYLLKENGPYDHYTDGYEEAVSTVEDFPSAADVALVRHGHWIVHKQSERHNLNECIECSECNTWFGHDCYAKTDFCPNCGAKMGGGVENAEN